MLDRHALKAVLTAVGRGDGAAFRNLFVDRAGQFHALALRLLRDPGDAEEALQQTFVEIWRLAAAGQADWEMPDLEMIRICRSTAGDIARRSGRTHASDMPIDMPIDVPIDMPIDVPIDMAHPVNDGTASFELLSLLNALGRMSASCRDAIALCFFEYPNRDALAERLGFSSDELTACLRRCYAEYLTASQTQPTAIDRETELVAMNQAFGLVSVPGNAAHDPLRRAWELRIAPLAEVLRPVTPPDDTFSAIMLRVNADQSVANARQWSRRTGVWRAAMYLMFAVAASALIYFGLLAVSEDAAATPDLMKAGEFR